METVGPRTYRGVRVVGLLVCGLGVLVALAGWIVNLATASDGGGANIGAGLMVFAGVGLAVCGVIVLLVGVVMHQAARKR
jgi:hypothetical protein